MKTNNVDRKVAAFLILLLVSFAILMEAPKQKQGRLIKPFPKEVQSLPQLNCGWCRAVKAYSLNVNCVHYGVKDSIE